MKFDAYAGNVWERNPHEVATAIAWGVKGRVEQGKRETSDRVDRRQPSRMAGLDQCE